MSSVRVRSYFKLPRVEAFYQVSKLWKWLLNLLVFSVQQWVTALCPCTSLHTFALHYAVTPTLCLTSSYSASVRQLDLSCAFIRKQCPGVMFTVFCSLRNEHLYVSQSEAVDVRALAPSSSVLAVLVLIRQPVFRPWQTLSLRSSYGLWRRLRVSRWGMCVCVCIYMLGSLGILIPDNL